MVTSFPERLAAAVTAKDSRLCVGLDPVAERLPGQSSGIELVHAATEFCCEVIAQVADVACAVKPQVAFFELFGADGIKAYETIATEAAEKGLIVIADIKRGDIGSTAAAYAEAWLRDPAQGRIFDAITVNPWFGTDGVSPFLDRAEAVGGGIFLLVKTSNPSSSEIQDLESDGQAVHERVAGMVHEWARTRMHGAYSSVGAVVGGTHPESIATMRQAMPSSWILVPGVGTQGGRAEDVAAAFDNEGLGAIINLSRAILYPWGSGPPSPETDWRAMVHDAAVHWRDAINDSWRAAR